jgi:hypothetical protein
MPAAITRRGRRLRTDAWLPGVVHCNCFTLAFIDRTPFRIDVPTCQSSYFLQRWMTIFHYKIRNEYYVIVKTKKVITRNRGLGETVPSSRWALPI